MKKMIMNLKIVRHIALVIREMKKPTNMVVRKIMMKHIAVIMTTVGQKAMITVMRHKSVDQIREMRYKSTVFITTMRTVKIPMTIAVMMAAIVKALK